MDLKLILFFFTSEPFHVSKIGGVYAMIGQTQFGRFICQVPQSSRNSYREGVHLQHI